MDNETMKARNRFESGFNCAQAILAQFGPDLGLTEEMANRMGAGLGGGIGIMGRTCGAVSGACLVLGLRFGSPVVGHENAARVSARVRDFIRRFEDRHGNTMCRGLIKRDIREKEALKAAAEEGVFASCPDYVQSAERLLQDMLDEDGVEK